MRASKNIHRRGLILTSVALTLLMGFAGCRGGDNRKPQGFAPSKSTPPPTVPPRQNVKIDPALVNAARAEVDKALESMDVPLHAAALEVIRQSGTQQQQEQIVKALSDERGAIRLSAAMAAGDLKLKAAHEKLLSMVNDADPVVSVAVRYALHRLGDVRFSHGLEASAQDNDMFVRGQTAMVLGQLGDKSAMKILRVLARDRAPVVRQQAAEAMWRLGEEEGMKELVGWTMSRYVDDREFAILALARPHNGSIRQVVRVNLTSEYPELNLSAAQAMGMLDSDEGYGVALEGMKSADPRIKVRTAQAFGMIGRADAQEHLKNLLKDNEPLVRLAAAGAVLQIEQKGRGVK